MMRFASRFCLKSLRNPKNYRDPTPKTFYVKCLTVTMGLTLTLTRSVNTNRYAHKISTIGYCHNAHSSIDSRTYKDYVYIIANSRMAQR